MKLIIDTDPGQDDLVAIVLASQLTEIAAITTVAGNASLADTTINALVAADLAGFDGPVVAGADRPRVRAPAHAGDVHGANGLAGAPRPRPVRRASAADAPSLIAELAGAGTWILGIGPLTNVAAAIKRDPTLARRVAGISIMGGAIATGNVSPVAEFNVWADPEAADIVLRAGARLVMCPLDLTTQVRYDEAWVRKLGHPYIEALLAHYLANHRYVEAAGAPLHDPCALLVVTHPHLFELVELPVAVECRGDLTRGMTVVDRRPWASASGANATVALGVDAPGVLELVAAGISRLG